jgi:hypothetical protein
MIISHRHKFIFIKTTKTAGTSIEIALSKFCGPDDIITPVMPEDEAIRKASGYPGPQNYLSPPWDYTISDVAQLLLRGQRKRRYYHHISAGEILALVGQRLWDDYFKFCVERNPWDRLVSYYYWAYKSEPRPAFAEYVRSSRPLALKQSGFEKYTIDGRIAVDKICRFENLEEELEAIRTRIGIPEKLQLPRAKSRFRKAGRSYRDYFGEGEKLRVAELFSDEISLFGYEF